MTQSKNYQGFKKILKLKKTLRTKEIAQEVKWLSCMLVT